MTNDAYKKKVTPEQETMRDADPATGRVLTSKDASKDNEEKFTVSFVVLCCPCVRFSV